MLNVYCNMKLLGVLLMEQRNDFPNAMNSMYCENAHSLCRCQSFSASGAVT